VRWPLQITITLSGGDIEPFVPLGPHGDVCDADEIFLRARLPDGDDRGVELGKSPHSELVGQPLAGVIGKPIAKGGEAQYFIAAGALECTGGVQREGQRTGFGVDGAASRPRGRWARSR
jgi:hypothetical protein